MTTSPQWDLSNVYPSLESKEFEAAAAAVKSRIDDLEKLFAAPHLHYHDLALLLLPILGFAIILVEAGVLRPEKSMYLPVAFSLLLLLGDISPARFVIPYLVMAFLVVGLWFPVKLLFTSRKMA